MAKDPFEALNSDFKDAVAVMPEAEIRNRISEVAIANEELRKAKKDDQDLEEKREALKYANEPYREGEKLNRLKIQFCKRVLEDRGGG
jgi:hypothetical protein